MSRKTLKRSAFILLVVLSFSIWSETSDWEKELFDSPKSVSQLKSNVTDNNKNSDDADWEAELEKDLKDQETRSKGSEGSRGTTSPVQSNQQMNRSAQNLMMDVSAAIDIVGAWDRNKPRGTGERIDNKVDVRSAEFGFTAAVDQWMRANFLGAAHGEDGKYYFEVHEANVQFPFLPLNTSLKVGQMFVDVGRLNRIHLHDRPFTMNPIVHEKFIGFESIMDTGAEFSILLPWKWITQELVLGATNGKKWGHAHSEGQQKNNPMGYAHLKHFYYFGNNWGTQFGFSGMRFEPTTDRKNQRYLYGMDAVLRWNRSNLREWMIMTEGWYQQEIFPELMDPTTFQKSKAPSRDQWGYYMFVDYKFHQLWSVGYRYDYFTDKSLLDKNGKHADNAIESHSTQITFHSSEFGRIRGSIERRYIQDFSKTEFQEQREWRFYVQAVAILGSHPAHSY
ncbi:hypothetical protein EHQ31_05630 [Leptospira montravelensis]|uniref:Porin n=1 Tax=Leptospira montravelensis TaxID=2484961 RepID=A0ABY2LZW4_9LEPT|nr:hypothetical protein EHQ19_06595 [Leptospira montravelensis]TGL06385.1 hypothetical protein EHQ31_05630 [Leptospira montravelensis]